MDYLSFSMCPVSTAQSAVIDIAVLNCVISMASANLTANFSKVSISAPQCVLVWQVSRTSWTHHALLWTIFS